MILTSTILNKLLNSGYIKNIYPMIDNIHTIVDWDEDEENPMYNIHIDIFVNDLDMNFYNMYERGLDPHYLIDEHMIDLLKFVDVKNREISQIYIRVINTNGEIIYG